MENLSFIYNGQTFTEGSKVRVIISSHKEEQDGEITQITQNSSQITFFVLFNNGDIGISAKNKKGWKKSWVCNIGKGGKPKSTDFPKLLKLAIPENIIEVDESFIN